MPWNDFLTRAVLPVVRSFGPGGTGVVQLPPTEPLPVDIPVPEDDDLRSGPSPALTAAIAPPVMAPPPPVTLPPGYRANKNLKDAMNEVYRLDKIRGKEAVLAEYDKKKDSMAKNIGKGLLMAMGNIAPAMMDPRISDSQALGLAVGAAGAGALGGVINPAGDEMARHQYEINKAMENVKRAQGIYGQDIENRANEAGIANIESQIGTRAQEQKRKQQDTENKLAIAQRKADTATATLLEKQYKDSPTFDPDGNPDHKAASDQYQAITGVPLAKKSADVKEVVDVPDAKAEKMFRTIVYKDGTRESGYVTPSGKLSSDINAGATFRDPRVESYRISGETRITTTGMNNETTLAKTRLETSAKMAIFKAKSRQELQNLITGLRANAKQGLYGSDGEAWAEEQIRVLESNNLDVPDE